jgi:hypothetical protein
MGMGLGKPFDPNDCLITLPQTKDMSALQSWKQLLPNNLENSGCQTTLSDHNRNRLKPNPDQSNTKTNTI